MEVFMNIELEQSLIDELRSKVSCKNYLIAKKFIANEGKNKWNIICSAMDWIDVTTKGLPYITLNDEPKQLNSHQETLKLMQVIVSVDILAESMFQLFRVFDLEYPLNKDNAIFKQTKISDDLYFKHIRAVFGTHPVNLTSVDGIKDPLGKRFYASWTSRDFTTSNTYQAVLYSNDPNTQDQVFTININDILQYANSRYQLMHIVLHKIDSIIQEHIDKYRLKKIILPEEKFLQLKVLREENEKRLCDNLHMINYLENMLSINIESLNGIFLEEVSIYQSFLTSLISKVATELELMNFNNVEIPYFFKGYNANKLYEYFNSNDNPIGFSLLKNFIKDCNIPEDFLYENNINILRLIIEALAYKKYQSNGTVIEL